MNGRSPLRRFRINIILLFGVVLFGAIGYTLIEGWDFLDSLFMTVITVAGVGYGEVHPLTSMGKIFTMILISSGVGLVAYTVFEFVGLLVNGHLTQEWRARQMEKQIDRIKDHYIICGLGEVGEQVAHEFDHYGVPFVAIDKLDSVKEICQANKWPFVQDTGTEESALKVAGIMRAKGVIAAVHDDTTNIYITITARALKPDLHIVARVNEVENLNLVRRAGADDLISVPQLAGKAMAEMAAGVFSQGVGAATAGLEFNKLSTKG